MERPPLPVYIDSTMLTCFRSCPRKFWNEFVLGLRPPGISIDLHAGGTFAHALEAVYRGIYEKGLSLPDAIDRAHAAYSLYWGNFEIPEWKNTAKTFDRVWQAVTNPGDKKSPGYFDTYPPATDHVQPYLAADGKATFEYTFAIPLEPTAEHTNRNGYFHHEAGVREHLDKFPLHPSGTPFLYCGRFDMLGSLAGRPVVRDEKTTGSSIGQRWSETWDLRSQFIGYTWACQQAGLDVDTVVVRGVAIQKTQIVHAEATKVYSDHIRARWLEQLRRDLWRLRRSYDEGYFDYNLGDACTAYGNCIFLTACQAPDDHQASWLGEFEVRHWNPLLKSPIQESAS